ncbi:hypothetical protein CEXT_396961 [Caerostris extrusa]|uniref:Uncharacterized protein n=1 Tax=Caerostris extrusa TaxID=172846 RepID=A0AAV4QAY0_CAEEX|nr:hypothetical protein CEXT_396961 [Caerostris extrusa]
MTLIGRSGDACRRGVAGLFFVLRREIVLIASVICGIPCWQQREGPDNPFLGVAGLHSSFVLSDRCARDSRRLIVAEPTLFF